MLLCYAIGFRVMLLLVAIGVISLILVSTLYPLPPEPHRFAPIVLGS
jgi:hypothetical protein